MKKNYNKFDKMILKLFFPTLKNHLYNWDEKKIKII